MQIHQLFARMARLKMPLIANSNLKTENASSYAWLLYQGEPKHIKETWILISNSYANKPFLHSFYQLLLVKKREDNLQD